MVFAWKKIIFFFLLFEVLLFLLLYCFGPNGLHVFFKLKEQKEKTKQEIKYLQEEIVLLQKDLEDSKTSFYKEKIARERILMKKDNEVVYVEM